MSSKPCSALMGAAFEPRKVFISGHWLWEARPGFDQASPQLATPWKQSSLQQDPPPVLGKAQMAHGAVSVVNKPYACHAGRAGQCLNALISGLPGWKTGWSAAKKTWPLGTELVAQWSHGWFLPELLETMLSRKVLLS